MAFQISPQKDFVLVTLSGACTGDETPNLFDECKKTFDSSKQKHFIYQCNNSPAIEIKFLRQMSAVFKEAKTRDGLTFVVAADEKIKQLILSNGLDRILLVRTDLQTVQQEINTKLLDIDKVLMQSMLLQTVQTLTTKYGIKATVGKSHFKNYGEPLLLGVYCGLISIVSPQYSGVIAISFDELTYIQLCDATQKPDQKLDLAAEIARGVLDDLKTDLASKKFILQMAMPSVIFGSETKEMKFDSGICVIQALDTKFGAIQIEFFNGNSKITALKKKAV